MSILTIYDRYILKKLIKNFIIYFSVLFAFFIVFDLSLKRSALPDNLIIYYASGLSVRAEFFVSIGFLFSVIHTILDCNRHFELVSLQMSGHSIFKITKTVFIMAFLLALINIINFEVFYPNARSIFERSPPQVCNIGRIILSDHSQLFYNENLSSNETFRDLFWIKSKQEIWHIQSLNKFSPYEALGIDRFHINKGKIENFFTSEKDNINLSASEIMPASYSYQHLSLRSLYSLLKQQISISPDKNEISISLYYNLLMSFLPILITVFILPFITSYHKNIPSLKIYAISFFVFIFFYLILKLGVVFAQNELLSPVIIMVELPLLLFLIGCYKLVRI